MAHLLVLAMAAGLSDAGPGLQAEPYGMAPVVCTADQLEEWQALVTQPVPIRGEEQHRVLRPDATDPACPDETDVDAFLAADDVRFTSLQDGRANDGIHSWVFASGCKRTVCGTLASFQNNLRLPFLSGEYDLNHNILVRPEDDVTNELLLRNSCLRASRLPELAQQEADLCIEPPPSGKPWLLHTEITPPVGLRRHLRQMWCGDEPSCGWKPWHERVTEKIACFHGPLVADTGHGAKAEVHPAQLIWWREGTDTAHLPGNGHRMYVIQDASSRFHREHGFVIYEPLPELNRAWRPWSAGPVSATFTIAFRLRAGETGVVFQFERILGESQPAELPPLALGRDAEVRWFKTDEPELLEVEAGFVCRCETAECAGSTVGTFRAKAKVGRDREWDEGYLAMRLTDSRAPAEAPPPPDTCDHDGSKCQYLPPRGTTPGLADARTPQILARLQWRSEGGWKDVPSAPDLRERMFREAGWTGALPNSADRIQRLRAARLTLRASLPGVESEGEEEEGHAQPFRVAWICPSVGEPQPASPCQTRGKAVGPQEIEIPIDGDELKRVDVVAKVSVAPGAAVDPAQVPSVDVKQYFWTHAFVDAGDTGPQDLTNERRAAPRRAAGPRANARRQWRLEWLDWGAKQCAAVASAAAEPKAAGQVTSELRNALMDARITLTELTAVALAIESCRTAQPTVR
jgi:hypothetical protein